MAFNVAEFRSNMIGDGARPNLFQVNLTFPTILNSITAPSRKISFMARAAQLPGSSVGTVPVYYFGRELKFAGNRTFADWTLQIINDEDFSIRDAIESWMNSMNSNAGNVRDTAYETPTSYTVDAQVTQYGNTGNTLKTYNFVGMFPLDLAPIDLDWGSNDSIEEFTMTLAYRWWETDSTT